VRVNINQARGATIFYPPFKRSRNLVLIDSKPQQPAALSNLYLQRPKSSTKSSSKVKSWLLRKITFDCHIKQAIQSGSLSLCTAAIGLRAPKLNENPMPAHTLLRVTASAATTREINFPLLSTKTCVRSALVACQVEEEAG